MFNVTPPILPASGTFGYGYEYCDLLDYNTLGAVVTKGITRYARAGNKQPRLFEIKDGLINSVGLENVGVDFFASDIMPKLARLNKKIIVNVAGFSISEFDYILRKLNKFTEITAYEINLSCPNVTEGGISWQTDLGRLNKLAYSLPKVTKKILLYKISPFHNILNIVTPLRDAGAKYMTIGNTLPVLYFEGQDKKRGGISGHVLKYFAQLAVDKVREKFDDLTIIACGGIKSIEDIRKYKSLGAEYFEIGTALFSNPAIFKMINEGGLSEI